MSDRAGTGGHGTSQHGTDGTHPRLNVDGDVGVDVNADGTHPVAVAAHPDGAGDHPRLTVLSGPSGVGKTTLAARVREAHPEVWLSVSATTRKPRPGEIDGVHYFFYDLDTFRKAVDAGEFLEHAEYAGNHYGTLRRPVVDRLTSGNPVLLEIELQGARQVRAAMPEARLVFLAPPSWDELVRRLTGRGTEPPDVIERRLDTARVELAAESEFDVTLVNTSVEGAAAELVTLMDVS